MRYGELLLKGEAKDLYQGILSQPTQPLKLKLQVSIIVGACHVLLAASIICMQLRDCDWLQCWQRDKGVSF